MSQTLLITGASRGIGAEIALQAAGAGFDICINYANNQEQAEAVASQIRSAGVQAMIYQADMAKEAEIVAMFEAVDKELGTLHGLINNAGITGKFCRVDELDHATAQRVMDVNIVGCMMTMREAVKRMSTTHGGKGGVIINISSVAARLGSPGEYVHYAASKGAVDAMTIGLAKEVAKEGIRVNAVRPGLIETDIHASSGDANRVERLTSKVPMQRGGSAKEVAEAILWLASDNASYTTGSFIEVSGGR